MPIIDVEIVTGPNDALTAGLAQSIADAAGRILDSPPGRTWVRLRVLAREHYAENGAPGEMTELPVFVTVLKLTVPGKAEMAGEISALTNAIAGLLGRTPSCVHIEYAHAAAGRISFGGDLVE